MIESAKPILDDSMIITTYILYNTGSEMIESTNFNRIASKVKYLSNSTYVGN